MDLLNIRGFELKIVPDYYSSFRRPIHEPLLASASDYLFGDSCTWQGDLLCPEMAIPRAWAHTIRLILPFGTPWKTEATAFLHAGRSGCMAPLHFDWDHAWVAHACLIGRKRLFFFPPRAGWMLNPIINTSAMCIPRMAPTDRQDLLSLLGGFELVLEAGQGVVFPSLYWHAVLYDTPSLAISARFESLAGGRPFRALPRSWLLQRLLWIFSTQGYGSCSDEFLFRYLEIFFLRGGWRQRYRRIISLCREALLESGERRGVVGFTGENFSSELALAMQELKVYYSDASCLEVSQPNTDFVYETFNYMFDSIDCSDRDLGMRLAAHAIGARQGLPPKRGLVRIAEE